MKALLLATALLVPAGAVLASSGLSEERQSEIRLNLTAQGYDVRKIDMEDGMIEVYALKDGARLELYLDDQLNIVKTKKED